MTDILTSFSVEGLPVMNQEKRREGHESGYYSCNVERMQAVDHQGEAAGQQVSLHSVLAAPLPGVGGEEPGLLEC